MKTLLVMRHAKSDWKSDAASDFDRPLNNRGKKNAPEQGVEIKKRNIIPDLIISSPANRAITTAKLAAKNFHYDNEIIIEKEFYFGHTSEIINKIKDVSNETNKLMIVGHNPTWTSLVELLSSQYIEMKTATVAVINFETDKWAEIENSKGTISTFFSPNK